MAYGAALEKRWADFCLVGSNPTLSAERCWSGLSGAPGERVSPLATVGSNPTLSANKKDSCLYSGNKCSSRPQICKERP